MNSSSRRLLWILGPLLGMVAGIAATVFYLGGEAAPGRPPLEAISDVAPVSSHQHQHQHQHQTYVCPMHPEITSDTQGNCPICGMDLVPVKHDDADAGSESGRPVVRIDPEVVNNMGVRTENVKRGKLSRRIDTMGMISKIISTRNVEVSPGIPGRLEWILEKDQGAIIHKGELLYTVLSPERIRAQEEYLESWDAQDNKLLPQLWKTLNAFHFSGPDIKRLEETREIERIYKVVSPQTGALIQRLGRPGDRVIAGSPVYTIGGYYKVDVNAEVFEQNWAWLKFRQRAVISVPSVPNGIFEGSVERVNEAINFKTRSLTARLTFRTLNPMVKEGMVADISIYAQPREGVLYVPRDAVIRTADEERVVVAMGEGRFRPVIVKTGIESGDKVEILEGLEEGQSVVVSGQFLIDSESSLSASFRRLDSDK